MKLAASNEKESLSLAITIESKKEGSNLWNSNFFAIKIHIMPRHRGKGDG